METKICKNCGEEKPLKMFYSGQYKDKTNYRANCTRCHQRLCKLRKFHRESLAKPSPYIFCEESWRDMKICSKCKTARPVEEFHKKGEATTSQCKYCASETKREINLKLSPEKKEYFKKKKQEKWHSLPLSQRKQIVKNRPKEVKERGRLATNERYRTDPEYRKERAIKDKLYREKKRATMTPAEKEIELEKRRKRRMLRQAREKNCYIIIPFTKADIIKRDGLNCYLCEKLLTEKEATIDHILPISRGGSHKPENVKIACQKCNFSKNRKTLTEFKKWRGDYKKFYLRAFP